MKWCKVGTHDVKMIYLEYWSSRLKNLKAVTFDKSTKKKQIPIARNRGVSKICF